MTTVLTVVMVVGLQIFLWWICYRWGFMDGTRVTTEILVEVLDDLVKHGQKYDQEEDDIQDIYSSN